MTNAENHYQSIGEALSEKAEASFGNLFGKPCLKIGKKAFAAFFQDEMVFKLGRETASPLLEKYPGAVLWDPSGKKRPMKDWLQVPAEYSDDWEALAENALTYATAS